MLALGLPARGMLVLVPVAFDSNLCYISGRIMPKRTADTNETKTRYDMNSGRVVTIEQKVRAIIMSSFTPNRSPLAPS